MVFPLRPGKFYGSSLPRPRIYDKPDGGHRVDPPLSVIDPFMSWAEEAHWSMGGISVKRLRLQGKIEGNVQKLRNQREKNFKFEAQTQSPISDHLRSKRTASLSPPPAPVATKRRKLMPLIEEKEEEVTIDALVPRKRRLVKKLGDDFDRVASSENEGSVAVVSDSSPSVRTRRRRLVKIGDVAKKVVEEGEKSKGESGKSAVSGIRVRTSPRLSKK